MPASAEVDIGLITREKAVRRNSPDEPFRIALVGDFSGRASCGTARRVKTPVPVDSSSLNEVIHLFDVNIRIVLDDRPLDISFDSLLDFHPAELRRRLPVFQGFSRLRRQLTDPARFAAAARVLSAPPPGEPPSQGQAQVGIGAAAQPAPEPAAGWAEVVRRCVTRHVAAGTEPELRECVAAVDAAESALMRSCLAHPAFQTVEAAWRSVVFLLDRLETRKDLRIELVDITKAELGNLLPSGWSAAASLHRFEPEPDDCRLLGRLAAIGRRSGGPVLAQIGLRLAGCVSLAETPQQPCRSRWATA